MDAPTIKLTVHGKAAELSLEDAREMLRQLKRVFGEEPAPVVIPWAQPLAPPQPFNPWGQIVWSGDALQTSTTLTVSN